MGRHSATQTARKSSGRQRSAPATKRGAVRRTAAKPAQDTLADEGPALRPAQCRAYMRRTLASEFKGIVAGFVKGAKAGSCQHVKLATELLEPRPKAKRSQSGRRTLERWLDELDRGV